MKTSFGIGVIINPKRLIHILQNHKTIVLLHIKELLGSKLVNIAEFRTVAKSLPLLRKKVYK